LHLCPAIRQPEARILIGLVFDKRQVFAIGNGSRRQLERFEKDAMPGAFIIVNEVFEGEVLSRRIGADLTETTFKAMP